MYWTSDTVHAALHNKFSWSASFFLCSTVAANQIINCESPRVDKCGNFLACTNYASIIANWWIKGMSIMLA